MIRRTSYTEKVLVVVKCRAGHRCATAWIVVCLVAWEGIPQSEADLDYTLLAHKLNRYGLPTTRRCATNENRTCACQGKRKNEQNQLNCSLCYGMFIIIEAYILCPVGWVE